MSDAAKASPRPWRVTEYDPGPQDIYDANGFRVCAMGITTSSDADAALIVDAVNERDRLREIVRRLVRVAINDRETLRHINSDTQYATDDDDAIGDALREARAALGEGEP